MKLYWHPAMSLDKIKEISSDMNEIILRPAMQVMYKVVLVDQQFAKL
jgi:hypothetical protein